MKYLTVDIKTLTAGSYFLSRDGTVFRLRSAAADATIKVMNTETGEVTDVAAGEGAEAVFVLPVYARFSLAP